MLSLATIFLSVLFLNKFSSPFSEKDDFSNNRLKQKNLFDERQVETQKKIDSTFIRIKKMDFENPNSTEESEISFDIDGIGRAFSDMDVSDTRKKDYKIMEGFFRMHFEDKKNLSLQTKNLAKFNKDYEDCKSEIEHIKQANSDRNNAYISSRRN